jgi:hypothetical protein
MDNKTLNPMKLRTKKDHFNALSLESRFRPA